MEELLQKVVRKLIKNINYNDITLKHVEHGYEYTQRDDAFYIVYKIKYKMLTIGSVVTIQDLNGKTKYVASLHINKAFRNMGIGRYILTTKFPKHFIIAGNPRAGHLYARLGRKHEKFTRKELEDITKLLSSYGMYKLDTVYKMKR